MPAPVSFRRSLRLNARPEELWPLVSNTNRFNRALALPSMVVEKTHPDYSQSVRASLYGIPLRWVERPFQWSENRWYTSVREFAAGPLTRFEARLTLAPDGDGTRLELDYTFYPRNVLGALAARWAVGRRAADDAAALLERFGGSSGSDEAFPVRRVKSGSDAGELARRAVLLRAADADQGIAEKLLHLAEHAHDDALTRMRPFELADLWGADRLETLKVFLHATQCGLLDLAWEVSCPNCAAPGESQDSLSGLATTAHCPSCDVDFGAHFDDTVEARFSISPTVRRVEARVYCVGNPSQTPHAVVQLALKANEPRAAEATLGAESYAVKALNLKRAVVLRPSATGPSDLTIGFDAAELAFKPGSVRLTFKAPGDTLARVEREGWKEKAARASIVTTLQDFRDLFSSEALAPGVEVAVRSLALLFTDLKDSTALYERVGDAAAYALVRDHFAYLFDIVRRRNGAVVKTIGDAVMAAFSRPADALEAALEMQEGVGRLNARLAPRPPVSLKIGLHAGPAIAINTAGALDYFGTTVNVAARVQSESAGGDVVVTRAFETLAQGRAPSVEFETRLKGLSDSFKLRRLTPKAHA